MRLRILIVALACIVAPCVVTNALSLDASKMAVIASTSLSRGDLVGGMQGQSGIVLDLNGDSDKDLVIGAPNVKQKGRKGIVGCLLVHTATAGRFKARPSALLRGDGNLGWSLVALGDIDGDGKEDFAAGAYSGSGDNVSLAGTVSIYQGSYKPRLIHFIEGEDAMDKFGYALASGDLNGDGSADLIVGAPYHSPSPDLYQQGAVYVYFGPGYDTKTVLKIASTAITKGIGFSLAAGDISGDGVDDLIMAASGKVISYYGVKGGFAPVPADPDAIFSSADRGFGRSSAVLWDLDGDGFKDMAVGADQAVVGDAAEAGRFFILRGGSGKRTVNADVASPDVLARIDGDAECGRLGSAILPLGDMDGDNTPDLAVSAVHSDGSSWLMTGKLFLFSGKDLTVDGALSSATAIPGEARDMHLGTFLALIEKEGLLVAGAPTESANTGSVWLFNLR